MPAPDILHFLHIQDFLRDWVASQPETSETELLRWMGERVELSREQVRNLIYEEGHVIQPDAIPRFARLFGLDDRRREYLRRLTVQQGAGPDEIQAARQAVWTLHAAAIGVPADAVAELLDDESDPAELEAATLALLPLLREHTGFKKPAQLARVLLDGPDAATARRAMEAEAAGLVLGAPGPRVVELPAPCGPEDWQTLCWHGLLRLARRALLRPTRRDRHFNVIIGSADAAALRSIERSANRLITAVRRVLSERVHQPVTHFAALLSEGVLVAQPYTRIYGTRNSEAGKSPNRLPRGEPTINPRNAALPAGAEAVEVPPFPIPSTPSPSTRSHPPGRPCIYHHLRFGPFVKEMVRWRKAHRKRASALWFAKKLGVSMTYANGLTNGGSRLNPDRAPQMAAVLELDADEAAYLDGVARFQEATDPEEQARARLALIQFAAKKGVRTIEGETFRISAHWGAHAILALADYPHFLTNAGWLTRVLEGRIPWQDARDLVKALLATGLLVPQESGPPRPSVGERQYKDPEQDLAEVARHDSVLRLLHAELRVPVHGQRFQGLLLALHEDALPRLQRAVAQHVEEVQQALREADARSREGQTSLDRVVVCATQLFVLSPDTRSLQPRR